MSKVKGYIVPHTHWDREWRYPIWKNRLLLIEFMEQLLNILDTDKEYKCFVLDGQSVIIKDYLEVKPQNEEKIKKYISEGRIKIGPWFTLPDLFPVDGESLIRNLMKGLRYCKTLGGNLDVGYNSFGWGQTAQFPQIYDKFGFDFIIAAKNISKERSPYSEFLWEAPDGTQVLTTRLGEHARANFFMNAYIPIMYNAMYTTPEYGHSWGKRGITYHGADSENYHNDHFKVKGRTYIHPQHLESTIERAFAGTDETLYPDVRLLMNGSDFSTPQPLLTSLIKQANEVLKDKELINASIEEYADILKANLDYTKLPTVKGEMRDGPASSCSSNALSTRPKIKQLNKKVQNAMYKFAEPMSVMANVEGYTVHNEMLDIAEEFMLKAHAHDSINGVTQDKTVDDTMYNLSQALEISNVIKDDACGFIVRNIDTSAFGEEDVLITVFNTLATDRSEIVKIFVDLPQNQNIWEFDIADENGNIYPTQFVSRKEVNVPVHELDSRPWPFYADRQEVYFQTGIVPAGGYKTYKIQPKSNFNRPAVFWAAMRKHNGESIAKNTTTLENENLCVTVNSNGSINIFNKEQNKEYINLNYYEETGDCGDYWVYYPPYHNKTYTSKGANAEIWVEDDGMLSATIATKVTLCVPKYAHKPDKGYVGDSKRSDEMTNINITTYYTLEKGAKIVKVKAIVNNTASDHRMKVLFDSGIITDTTSSAGHFTVDERKTTNEYPEMETMPMGAFASVSDGNSGLSILSNCFSEYAVDKDIVKVSLFRGVRNIICSEFRSAGVFEHQNGGQSLGELEFNYAIYPHSKTWENGAYAQYEKFATPIYPIQTCCHEGKLPLPLENSYYKLEGENLVLSTIKKAEDSGSTIVRIYNPTNETITGKFYMKKANKAYQTNLNEVREVEMLVSDSSVELTIAPHKIQTLEVIIDE